MKRLPVTGSDRDPTGAHHLAHAEGLKIGDRVIIFLCDEPLECEAVVQTYPGWEPHLFANPVGSWRPSPLGEDGSPERPFSWMGYDVDPH